MICEATSYENGWYEICWAWTIFLQFTRVWLLLPKCGFHCCPAEGRVTLRGVYFGLCWDHKGCPWCTAYCAWRSAHLTVTGGSSRDPCFFVRQEKWESGSVVGGPVWWTHLAELTARLLCLRLYHIRSSLSAGNERNIIACLLELKKITWKKTWRLRTLKVVSFFYETIFALGQCQNV